MLQWLVNITALPMSKNNKKEDPNEGATFSVSVAEEVKMSEQSPGGATGENKEQPSREEIMKKVTERKVYLGGKYVPAHKKKARWVTESDIQRLVKDAQLMAEMCLIGRGEYNMVDGIAHTQIEQEDPLRFFVRHHQDTGQSEIIINPVILNTNGSVIMGEEGCLTFPEEPLKTVGRYKGVRVEYQTLGQKVNRKTNEPLSEPYLTDRVRKNLSGHHARIYQHEVAHLNGKYIYDEDHNALDCVGCDDQPPVEKDTIDKS